VTAWKPGDRVEVYLPDRRRWRWFSGTVREVDTGPRPRVLVALDQVVSGVSDCYATHAELRRLPAGSGEAVPPENKER
jgi:hypothetical protein